MAEGFVGTPDPTLPPLPLPNGHRGFRGIMQDADEQLWQADLKRREAEAGGIIVARTRRDAMEGVYNVCNFAPMDGELLIPSEQVDATLTFDDDLVALRAEVRRLSVLRGDATPVKVTERSFGARVVVTLPVFETRPTGVPDPYDPASEEQLSHVTDAPTRAAVRAFHDKYPFLDVHFEAFFSTGGWAATATFVWPSTVERPPLHTRAWQERKHLRARTERPKPVRKRPHDRDDAAETRRCVEIKSLVSVWVSLNRPPLAPCRPPFTPLPLPIVRYAASRLRLPDLNKKAKCVRSSSSLSIAATTWRRQR